jgi:hypothetical protein
MSGGSPVTADARPVPPADIPVSPTARLMLYSALFLQNRGGTTLALEVPQMRRTEYLLSLALAVLVLTGLVVWTQASTKAGESAVSCQRGKTAQTVMLRGMSLYPRCPGGKTG